MTSRTRQRAEQEARDPYVVSKIDGERRKQSIEDELDSLFFAYFNDHVGEQIMRYLRNLFVNSALPMGTTGEQVLYREGARSVVTLIEARRQAGEKKQHLRRQNEP